MRRIRTLKHSPIFLCMFFFMQSVSAQVCTDPAGTIYGLDNNGGLFPINVSNGSVGARINPAYTGNPPAATNAVGYSPSNGKFYYFKRNADNAPQEFVSFNPSTNTYAALSNCPTTNNIRTGCVNETGTGYYCIDATATLYFYRFSSNTWKVITSTFFDQGGTNITATLAARSSGDIAIDGWGKLWFLCSSTTNYGLYAYDGTLPVASVASMTLLQKLSPSTLTPGGNNFAGIGFSPTGQIYLSQAGDKLYRMNTDESLTLIGTFTTSGVGGDLTSCVFPMMSLAIDMYDLNVKQIGGDQTQLSWTGKDLNVKGYFVEYSADGANWKTLTWLENNNTTLTDSRYTYTYQPPTSGRYYYRIRQVGVDGRYIYSQVKFVDITLNNLVSIGPNPTKGNLQVANNANAFSSICILDIAGHLIKHSTLKKGINTIDIGALPTGTYLLRLESDLGQLYHQKIIKE